MSGVVQRYQKKSNLKVFEVAINIRDEVLSIIDNEKYVPKRHRLIYGIRMFEEARRIVNNISYANAVFPSNNAQLLLRKMYQQKAVCACDALVADLSIIVNRLNSFDGRIALLIGEINKEANDLRTWRRKSTITRNKSKFSAAYGELNANGGSAKLQSNSNSAAGSLQGTANSTLIGDSSVTTEATSNIADMGSTVDTEGDPGSNNSISSSIDSSAVNSNSSNINSTDESLNGDDVDKSSYDNRDGRVIELIAIFDDMVGGEQY